MIDPLRLLLGLVAGLLLFPPACIAEGQTRPNIVWIVTEDNAPEWLRLYNPDGGAPMPHVESLAARGLTFNHAFSNAPVCSVARSTLISGCCAPRVGSQYHRRAELVPLPDGLKMFPWYLQQAGYHTTNNSKEDYNFVKNPSPWDESSRKASYRGRREGQPFFHVQNFTTTHESRLHFNEKSMATRKTATDPEGITVFPYHPNTPTFRYTYARQLEQHRIVDEQIGSFLKQLEDDELLDDTIIFYYGDHGGVLPRGKGYAYESGLQVPLVVTVPERWRDLFPAKAGSRIDGFVSFVDFAPTVLHLAGVKVPPQMDGKPFLGEGVSLDELNARHTTFGYADRFDEKYDPVRTWRQGRFKYIRNYQPFNIDGLQNNYRYRMLAYQEWRRMFQAGELNDVQSQFFRPRPAEMLFDLDADPHETTNLAGQPKYRGTTIAMRRALQQHVRSLPDLSFLPEPYFLKNGIKNPVAFGERNRKRIATLIATADLCLDPLEDAKPRLLEALESKDPLVRYWGFIACSSYGVADPELVAQARYAAASDPERLVSLRAIEFLGLLGIDHQMRSLTRLVQKAESASEALLMLNTATLLQDGPIAGRANEDFELDPKTFPQAWLKEGRRTSDLANRLEYLNNSRPVGQAPDEQSR